METFLTGGSRQLKVLADPARFGSNRAPRACAGRSRKFCLPFTSNSHRLPSLGGKGIDLGKGGDEQ